MSLFTKVLLLIIAQIIVIVGCLYLHLDDFQTQPSIASAQEAESKPFMERVKSWISKDESSVKSLAKEPIVDEADKIKEDIKENDSDVPAKTEVIETVKAEETIQTSIKKDIKEEVQEKIEKTEPIIKKEVQKTIKKEAVVVSPKKALPPRITVEKPVKKEEASAPSIITDAKVKALFKKKALENNENDTPLVPTKSNEAIEKEISLIVSKNGIIFKRLSTEVTEKSVKTIEKIAAILKEHSHVKIEVGGHTDAKGDEDVNAYVSKHRALSVRKLLIKFGIDKKRLSAKGYGESMPIVKNDPQGYSILNRRVEFKIIKE